MGRLQLHAALGDRWGCQHVRADAARASLVHWGIAGQAGRRAGRASWPHSC